MKANKLLSLLLLGGFLLVGCKTPATDPTKPTDPSEPSVPSTPSEPTTPSEPSVPGSYSFSLKDIDISMKVNETYQLQYTVSPEDAEIIWASSNNEVVTVDKGLLTGVGAGEAIIYAKLAADENIKDQCAVTVSGEWHDYVTDGSVKLGLDFEGKDFFNDGVEKVELLTPIDGDTAHFKTGSGKTLKARFYGIDTPESTGKVQEWGYEASEFTTTKLNNAKKKGTIVVSSPSNEYGAPDPDSTGSRYVSLVWINETKKNASIDELYLLNLWVVQEGLSLVKNIDAFPEYESSFEAAEAQAKAYELCLWSKEKAPHWNPGAYEEISLLEIKREVELSIADQSHKNIYDNKYVTFTGVVSSYADGTLYIQEFYPIDDDHPDVGEWAGINIFCGMSAISTKFTKTNTYLRVYGLAKDSEIFGFQITDTQGHWAAYAPDEDDCVVLLKAEENIEEHSLYTFHYTVDELNAVAKSNNCESLFCSVAVEGELICDYCYVSDDRAITLGFSNTDFGVYIPFAYHGDQSSPETKVIRWDEKSDFEGKKFRLDLGTYAWHRQTSGKVVYQIIPTNELSFVWLGE